MKITKKKFIKYSLCPLLVLTFFFLPFLPLKNIKVQGNNFVSSESIIDICNIFKEKHIIKLLTFKSLQKDILKTFNEIENVRLKFKFPNTFVLTIYEKKPWVLCISDGKSWLIAKDGTIISTNESAIKNDQNLLIIKGLKKEFFNKSYINSNVLKEIMQYKEILSKHFSETKLMIETDDLYHINLVLEDHVQVYLGEFLNSNKKLTELKRFLSFISAEKLSKINYIDLRVDKKVFVEYGS